MRVELIPLSQLATVRSGGGAPQNPSAFSRNGYPFVRAGSLPKLLDGASEDILERLEPRVAEQHGLFLFPSRTVVFAKSGMSATKGHVYSLKGPAYVVNHLAALIPHERDDSEFLVRALQRFSPTVLIRDSAYPSIRLGDIESMKVMAPLDSTGRQRIADVLDRAEALRAMRRTALAQLDALTQAIFLDMFGDPVTNPKEWQVLPLEQVATTTSGGTPSRDEAAYFGGKVPWVKSGELHQGMVLQTEESLTERGIAESSAKVMPVGTVLVAMYGATVGAVAVLGIEAATNQAICCIRPRSDLDAIYLVHLLLRLSPSLIAKRVGGAQPNLSQELIRKLKVPLPPPLRQSDFASCIATLEDLKTFHRASLAKLDSLFASLQHRAFRGEL